LVSRKVIINILFLAIASLVSLTYGGMQSESLNIFNLSHIDKIVALELRLPKIITAIVVGLSLSIAGHLYQVMLSNSLAEPSLLGVSGFCSLFIVSGAAIYSYYAIKYDVFSIVGFGIVGACIAIYIVFTLAKRIGSHSSASLILTGICLTTITSAITSWLIYYTNNDQLRGFSLWMLGSFEHVTYQQLLIISALVIPLIAYVLSKTKQLNFLYLGEKNAQLYGVNVIDLRRKMLITASILTAAAVTLGGILTFVGLLIPHATRFLVGHNNNTLLPNLIINGALCMVFVEWISRTMTPLQLPLSLVTTSIGGPLFLFVLYRHFKDQGL